MKRYILFILTLLLIFPLITACNDESSPTTIYNYIDGYEFKVTFGSNEFNAVQINSTPENNNITIYTHDYKLNGNSSIVIGESQEDRTAISVRCLKVNNEYEYDIVEITEDVANAPIPVNGFVITIPTTELDGVRANVGQLIKVEGYFDAVSSYERHDLATIAPDYLVSVANRRVSISNPINGFVENKVYYITSDFKGETDLTINNIVVTAKAEASHSCDIVSVEKKDKISAPSKGNVYFVFTGEYNIAYANYYFSNSERISFSMLDKCNSYSDSPAVIINNETIEFNSYNYNVSDIKDPGVYIFDNNFDSSVTPTIDIFRRDYVIVDGLVAQVSADNARTLIPDGNGFVITFVGEDTHSKYSLELGKGIQTCFVDYVQLPDKYVKVGEYYFPLDIINGTRAPEGVTALYDSDFGATTNSNEYGSEIVISNGKVTEVNVAKGNSIIPENGYVLSIHKDSPSYANVRKVQIGDEASVSFTGSAYSVNKLTYSGINQVRLENTLIVYQGKASSQTNAYGFEIAIDNNGIVIDADHNGDMSIPKGGFVLSGHGTNQTALEKAYAIGQTVVLNSTEKSVSLIKTPDLKIAACALDFSAVSDKVDAAKKAFLNLNYNSIDAQIKLMEALIEDAESAFKVLDFDTAFEKAESVISTCKSLEYELIESKGVENRAVWYRATENSDEAVKATVEKMKTLNVNALYIETWYEGYCIGSKVDIDGIARNSDFDVLESFIRIGHQYGIEVHAWVHNFFVGYYYKGGPSYYNPIFDSYKSKYLVDKNGNDFFYYAVNNNYFIFLNPYERECRDLLLNIYQQLITKYDLDGLHLDYVRFPELNYTNIDFGYNDNIINAFAKETGITKDPRTFANGSNEMKQWIDFRCNIITSFIGEVYDMVRDNNKDIWLSAATYPDLNMAKNSIFQDVRTFVEKGYFDEIFSMSYGENDAAVMPSVNSYISITKDKTFYSAGIAAFLQTSQYNFAQQLTNVEYAGADGVSVFALNSISHETYQYQMTNGAFRLPAIQCYKLSETTSAQMDYIICKIDNIKSIYTVLNDEDITYIKDKCNEIKLIANELDLENASVLEKITWCNTALNQINSAISDIISECGDNAETKSLICEFEDLAYWLTLSAQRLNTRK